MFSCRECQWPWKTDTACFLTKWVTGEVSQRKRSEQYTRTESKGCRWSLRISILLGRQKNRTLQEPTEVTNEIIFQVYLFTGCQIKGMKPSSLGQNEPILFPRSPFPTAIPKRVEETANTEVSNKGRNKATQVPFPLKAVCHLESWPSWGRVQC